MVILFNNCNDFTQAYKSLKSQAARLVDGLLRLTTKETPYFFMKQSTGDHR